MKRIGLTLMTILIMVFPMYSQKYNHVDVDTVKSLGMDPYCHSIYAINDSSVWADFASKILRSLDSGKSWEEIAVPDTVQWTSLRPLNTDTAFFSAMYSGFYKTTDGGKNWEDMNKVENHPNHFHFFDNNDGMILEAKLKIPYFLGGIGDTLKIWKTTDGGYTWIEIKEPDRPAFLPDETYYHHANNMSRQTFGDTICFGTSLGRVFMSHDRGNTWQAFYTGLGENQFIISMAMHNTKNMMLLSDRSNGGKEFKSSFTNDGGKTWTTRSLGDGSSGVAALPGLDSSFVLLKGVYSDSKGFYITHDGGKTYRKLLDVPCHTLTFVNDSIALMPSTYMNQMPNNDYIFRLTFKEMPVNIPDTAFLYALIDKGVDTNEDSLISYEEAEAVTYLDVSGGPLRWGGNILDMSGIEAFINLDSLACRWNKLSNLDVSSSTNLSVLKCGGNNLTSLDVSGCTKLKHLFCGTEFWMSGNPLTNLDLSNNTALIVLNASEIGLTTLDVSNNTALWDLQCFRNQLTSLDLSNNIALKELWCADNQLTSLDVSNNTALCEMACTQNQLASLDISNNRSLQYLIIDEMPTLTEVCVWETFSLNSVEVVTTESPNVCFQTDCNGDCSIVGIENTCPSELSIYPNPTNNLLTIEADQPDHYSIKITSLNGQLIYSTTMEGTEHQLDLSTFQKGVYFITIRSEDSVTTRKIIKL